MLLKSYEHCREKTVSNDIVKKLNIKNEMNKQNFVLLSCLISYKGKTKLVFEIVLTL